MSKPAGVRVEEDRSTAAGPSDAALVRQVQSGRRAAFDQLVERHQRRATSVAYRLLGNLHDALEVVQEAFVRAYRHLGTLDDPERFGSWLLRITTNLALNQRRSRRAGGPRLSLDDCIRDDQNPGELVSDSEASEDRPGAQLAADEMSELLSRALGELPEQQRAALVLFSIEQLPQKEVAQMLNCSVEAVKWHVFQARRKLREMLAAHL